MALLDDPAAPPHGLTPEPLPLPDHAIAVEVGSISNATLAGLQPHHSHIVLRTTERPIGDGGQAAALHAIAMAPAICVGLWTEPCMFGLSGAALSADVVVLVGAAPRRTGAELLPGIRPFIERRVGSARAGKILETSAIWPAQELVRIGLADEILDEAELPVWLAKAQRRSIGEFGTYRARRRVHPISLAAIAADVKARSLTVTR